MTINKSIVTRKADQNKRWKMALRKLARESYGELKEEETGGRSVLVHDPGDGFTSCAKSPASPRLVLGCTDRVFQHRAHEMVLRLPGPVGREDRVVVCRNLQVRLPMRHLSLPSMVEIRQAVTGQAITPTPCDAREEESSIMPVATQPIE